MQYLREINVFTDGSFSRSSRGITCGYGIYFTKNEFPPVAAPFDLPNPTNQRAELYAIYKGLKIVANSSNNYDIIKIYTDSMYSIQSLTKWIHEWKMNNWMTANKKPVKNTDIIIPIDDLITNKKLNVKFIHVRAHTNLQDEFSIANDIVDKLAKLGGQKY